MKNLENKVLVLNTTEVVLLQRAVTGFKDSLGEDTISESQKEVLLNIEEKLNHLKALI